MRAEERFDAFEAEAEEKWGHTPQWAESQRRTKGYGKKEWGAMRAEADAISQALAALMDEGVPVTDARATEPVEKHRLHIDRWFYPCSRELHASLGEMYVEDPRFAASYDRAAIRGDRTRGPKSP